MPYHGETKILCINKNNEEIYVPIKDIRVGDYVKTYAHGEKKVTHMLWGYIRNHIDKNPRYSLYCCLKTNENGLNDDLIVTGGTNLLVDGIEKLNENEKRKNAYYNEEVKMVDDKILLSCSLTPDFLKMEYEGKVELYQMVLENEDENGSYGIWANNMLMQSCSYKNRRNDQRIKLLNWHNKLEQFFQSFK